MGGNKAQLRIMKNGKEADFMADYSCYIYELVTSLLCRMHVLSIPDERVAKIVGVGTAVVEVASRFYHFFQYRRLGLNQSTWSAEDKSAYAAAGRFRVLDAGNDMVVEYVSAVIAAFVLFYLPATGVYEFARVQSEESVSEALLMKLLMYQVVSELICDGVCTALEITFGLRDAHLEYWSFHATQKRNFEKAFVLKLLATGTTTGLILIQSMR